MADVKPLKFESGRLKQFGATDTIPAANLPPGGGFTMDVEDEGVAIQTDPSVLNFVGAGVTATALLGEVTVTIPGAGSALPYAPGSLTVATATALMQIKRLQLTSTQRLTVAGTGRFRLSN